MTMLRYHTTAFYDASPETIFPILADFGRMEEWNPNVRTSTTLSGEPLQVGTEVRCELRWPFPPSTSLHATLKAIDVPHRVTYHERTTFGPFTLGEAEDRLTLLEGSDGTVVTFETEAHLNSVFRIAKLLPLSFYERQLDRVAEGLRTRLHASS